MIDAAIYKQVMGSFPSGVTVITTLDDNGQIVGLTASAFSSLSMDPALVLFCPNYSSDSYPVLIKNKRFAIHVLSGGQQSEAYAFARKGKDKAQGIEWTLSELGNPILANATAVIECELWREYEGGDHAIMVGAVKNLIVPQQTAAPLVTLPMKTSSAARLVEPTTIFPCVLDVSRGWGSETSGIFAAELGDAFIADPQRGGVHVYTLGQHQAARGLQP